jgi:hypothetical protein
MPPPPVVGRAVTELVLDEEYMLELPALVVAAPTALMLLEVLDDALLDVVVGAADVATVVVAMVVDPVVVVPALLVEATDALAVLLDPVLLDPVPEADVEALLDRVPVLDDPVPLRLPDPDEDVVLVVAA